MIHLFRPLMMRFGSFAVAAVLLGCATGPLHAQAASRALPPCTPRTLSGTACVPFFGGALNAGDPPVTDMLSGASAGAVTNYSLAGDGSAVLLSFSYEGGNPIIDNAVGFLIYDGQGNLVALRNAVGNPPSTAMYRLATNPGVTYQVQVFAYWPVRVSYTLSVAQG